MAWKGHNCAPGRERGREKLSAAPVRDEDCDPEGCAPIHGETGASQPRRSRRASAVRVVAMHGWLLEVVPEP